MIILQTTTEYRQQTEEIIAGVDRLAELVTITTTGSSKANGQTKLLYVNKVIKPAIDWHDTLPPYLFPPLPLNSANLLALVFYFLGNHQKAFAYTKEADELYNHLLIATNLHFNYTLSAEQLTFLGHTSGHNLAIAHHYGQVACPIGQQELASTYEAAIKNAGNLQEQLFTVKHYATFLIDSGHFEKAEKLLHSMTKKTGSEAETHALNHLLAASMMARVTLPFDKARLAAIRKLQLGCIAYYETLSLQLNAGLLLLEVAEIAGFAEDFIAAKKHIEKAIQYFTAEDTPELLGEALIRKATLLYNWSKNGSPQYYKPAINTFQNALKVFKKDTHPQHFADIHHRLALIYSEIPVAEDERPLWAAFCASSFKEALAVYTRESFPYEYAMVCHNYATALMGFPEGKLHNNLDKAFNLFEEALTVRSAARYPLERTLTLLNQLELYWLLHNEDQAAETKTLAVMQAKAEEIKQLATDKKLLKKAAEHLHRLAELEQLIG